MNIHECLAPALASHKVDGLLVTNLHNIRYLTGFTGSNALLLVLPGAAEFFTDPRYRLQSAEQVGCRIHVKSGPLLPAVMARAAKLRIRKIAVEQASIGFSEAELIKTKFEIQPASGLIEGLRMVKSDAEIALIRKSVEINSLAFEEAVKRVKAGMREFELAAEIDYRMRRLGASGAAFETIVASGARSARPHSRPSEARLESGQLVLIDMGAMSDGYASDMTRMIHLGRAPKKVRDLYSAVREAQLAAIEMVKPGVTGARVDKAARDMLKSRDLGRNFVHSTGHGLGLEIHEDPRIGKAGKLRLEEGMAITIEPGIYLEGWGGIRIEDTVVVKTKGCEVLTPTSKELREL